MIVEKLMHHFNWTDVWYAHPGPFKYPDRFHVGVWAGVDLDLLCVKDCKTNEEAEEWLSPGANSIFMAAIKAALKVIKKGKKDGTVTTD